MAESSGRTLVTSVLFLDIVQYSRKSVSEQIAEKKILNDTLARALKPVGHGNRVILDTGDGAAVTFLGSPEDALFAGLIMQQARELALRIGINLGPVRLVRDLNGQTNILGDGINVGQRIMSFADAGELLVSRSFYEVVSRLSHDYDDLFTHAGGRLDKHVREHEIYRVNLTPEALPAFVEAVWGEDWCVAVGLSTSAERAAVDLGDQPAQVFNAGAHFIISGTSQFSVLSALEELAKSGSRVLSPISKVGNKWIATCDHPPPEQVCNVEELGFMRIVTGPSHEAVSEKLAELIGSGGRLVHDLEQVQGVWTAVCEINPQ